MDTVHFSPTLILHSGIRENLEDSETPQKCYNYPKIGTMWFNHRVMHPKDVDGMANSVGALQSGSALFAKTCLSEK